MRIDTLSNIAKFLYDCGKVTFAVLVVGAIAKKPFIPSDIIPGAIFTLILLVCGAIMDQLKAFIKET